MYKVELNSMAYMEIKKKLNLDIPMGIFTVRLLLTGKTKVGRVCGYMSLHNLLRTNNPSSEH